MGRHGIELARAQGEAEMPLPTLQWGEGYNILVSCLITGGANSLKSTKESEGPHLPVMLYYSIMIKISKTEYFCRARFHAKIKFLISGSI